MNDFTKSGEFLADLRKSKGLTQSELGELIGAGDKTISKWERGINVPDVIMLNKLAKVLDISIHEILNGKKDDKIDPKFVKMYENKNVRYPVYLVFAVFFIIFIILLIYFCNNFDRFRMYRFDSMSNDYELTGNIYQAGNHYELIIDDFDVFDKVKYKDLEVYDYKMTFYANDKKIFSISRMNFDGNNVEKKLNFNELIVKLNKTKIFISKFVIKEKSFDGKMELEVVNDKEKVIEEYKIKCFLEYHNNHLYYKK